MMSCCCAVRHIVVDLCMISIDINLAGRARGYLWRPAGVFFKVRGSCALYAANSGPGWAGLLVHSKKGLGFDYCSVNNNNRIISPEALSAAPPCKKKKKEEAAGAPAGAGFVNVMVAHRQCKHVSAC